MQTPANRDALVAKHGEAAVRHSERFRKVSTLYPRMVAEAYDGNIEAAATDSDEMVAVEVEAWELSQGLEPKDWEAIGREERGEEG